MTNNQQLAAITAEERAALVCTASEDIHFLESVRERRGHLFDLEEQKLALIRIALASLTQPVSPALKLPWSENTCRECGSKSLSWGFAIINKSAVQNGLLRISDVDGLFYLGCDECSETVTRVSPDEVVELLTALQQFINAPHTAQIEPICATGGAEWVKCSNELPKKDGQYWGWWSEEKRQGPVWFIERQSQFQSYQITHWMPLPAAPTDSTT